MDKRVIVHKAIDMPDGSGKLLVLDWSSDGPKRRHNLVRVDTSGDEIWKAELPPSSSPDCFTDVGVAGNLIHAHTFSCSRVTLDRETAKTLSTEFTK
jgi:hypothetical protein